MTQARQACLGHRAFGQPDLGLSRVQYADDQPPARTRHRRALRRQLIPPVYRECRLPASDGNGFPSQQTVQAGPEDLRIILPRAGSPERPS